MKLLHKILILIIITTQLVISQGNDEEKQLIKKLKRPVGNEFWFTFMKNYDIKANDKRAQKDLLLELYIAGDKDANVKIEISALNISQEVFVKGGTVKTVEIDERAEVNSYLVREQGLAVHVLSDNPITLYALSHRFQTTDSYLVFPNSVLGTSYRIMSYKNKPLPSQFSIVATEDETRVQINPNDMIDNGYPRGTAYEIFLNKGDVYQVSTALGTPDRPFRGDADLTGSVIKANKKIAVFSGHQCAYIPSPLPKITGCNHLIEQMPPLTSWGKHFYIGKLEKRSKFSYRVLADQDSTKVFVDSELITILNAGEFYEAQSNKDIQVTGDKPLLVSQYAQGYKNGDFIGDPMMIMVSPTQQFLKEYRFATPINGEWNHYINVVAPTASILTMTLNGSPISPSKFKQLGLTRYSIAYLQVPFGSHYIKGSEPFGMYSYGFGFGSDAYDAYGAMGGQSFVEYVPEIDKSAPTAELLEDDGNYTLIFRDDNIDDTGLRDIIMKETSNVKADLKVFSEGTPQLSIPLKYIQFGEYGKAIFEAIDVEGNKSLFTICYTLNEMKGNFVYELNEGTEVQCSPVLGYDLGFFSKGSYLRYNSDFASTENFQVVGNFGDEFSSGGLFGISLTKLFSRDFHLSGRLSLENLTGDFTAPDSITRNIRDEESGELIKFQESTDFNLSAYYLGLGINADYYIRSYLYFTAGINLDLVISNNIDVSRRIITPSGYVYDNNSNIRAIESPDSFESLNTINFALYGGLGFKYPIAKRIFVFAESGINYYPSSIISDGDLNLTKISIIIGGKYRVFF